MLTVTIDGHIHWGAYLLNVTNDEHNRWGTNVQEIWHTRGNYRTPTPECAHLEQEKKDFEFLTRGLTIPKDNLVRLITLYYIIWESNKPWWQTCSKIRPPEK